MYLERELGTVKYSNACDINLHVNVQSMPKCLYVCM